MTVLVTGDQKPKLKMKARELYCICAKIKLEKLRKFSTIEEVKEKTKAATFCKLCEPYIIDILNDECKKNRSSDDKHT